MNNFPLKTLKLGLIAFHSITFQLKCLASQSNQYKKLPPVWLWPPFHCFGTPIWPHNIMCIRSILQLIVQSFLITTVLEVQFCGKMKDGKYPIPRICTGFVSCSGGVTRHEMCPNGTLFNPVKRICDLPHNVKCSHEKDLTLKRNHLAR